MVGAVLALGLTSCQFQLFRIRRFEPIPQQATVGLGREHASLQTCLDQLGAPNLVWESPRGLTVAYAWLDKFDWQISAQLYGVDPTIDGRTIFSYDSVNNAFDGAVLVFDEQLKLRFVRHGLLSDITRDLQRPPAYIEGQE